MKVAERTVTQRLRALARAVRETGPALLKTGHALPSFFIVGPPRTGTSWLHNALDGHAVVPHVTKETRFFDRYFNRGVLWYLAQFPISDGTRPVGEVAPTYFASAEARERIARLVPDAKIICIFRNPLERIVSLYRFKRAYAMTRWSFEQAIIRDAELMESAQYVTNLTAWRQTFSSERVLATLFDDLQTSPQSYVDALADFTGIPRFSITPLLLARVNESASMTHPRSYYRTRGAILVAEWCKARRLHRIVTAVKNSRFKGLILGGGPPFTELPQETLEKLSRLFRPEIEALEAVLNRDLSAWKGYHGGLEIGEASLKASAAELG